MPGRRQVVVLQGAPLLPAPTPYRVALTGAQVVREWQLEWQAVCCCVDDRGRCQCSSQHTECEHVLCARCA